MAEKSYYVVWRISGEAPTKRHESIESAREEAKRLAVLHQESEFVVLRAVESIKYRSSPFQITSYCKR